MTEPGEFRILAVCSGNVCRSPLAELLLRDILALHRAEFMVTSAGTIAKPGVGMTQEMVSVASRHGVDEGTALQHRASRLDERAVSRADLILGMTREHRAEAVLLRPDAVKRAFTLKEFARLLGSLPVPDTESAHTPAEIVARASRDRGTAATHDVAADDIDDPIGRAQEVYARVGDEIAGAVGVISRVLIHTRPGDARTSQDAPSPGGPSLTFSFRPA